MYRPREENVVFQVIAFAGFAVDCHDAVKDPSRSGAFRGMFVSVRRRSMRSTPQGKGNDMALAHPGKVPPVRSNRELHPAIGLLCGFGVIALAASAVHILFSLL
jgi:hypothetical protein